MNVRTPNALALNVRGLAVLSLFALAAPALAVTPWTAPSGSSATVNYSNGRTDTGHYTGTSPTVSNDTFLFTPDSFTLTESNGVPYDAALFTVAAKSGRGLSNVSAKITGDYSYLSPGDPPVVNVLANLTLTNPANNATITRAFNFGSQFASSDGSFAATVTAAIPAGWTSALVKLDTTLVNNTVTDGTASLVQVKGATIDFDTVQNVPVVPLPPALLAAIPGIAVAYMARKRAKRS